MREPSPRASKRLPSAVAAHRRTRLLLGLAALGALTVVLLLGSRSVVPLAAVAGAALVTFIELPADVTA